MWIFSGFFFIHYSMTVHWIALGCGQNKTFEDVILRFQKSWSSFLPFSNISCLKHNWLTEKIINRSIKNENNHELQLLTIDLTSHYVHEICAKSLARSVHTRLWFSAEPQLFLDQADTLDWTHISLNFKKQQTNFHFCFHQHLILFRLFTITSHNSLTHKPHFSEIPGAAYLGWVLAEATSTHPNLWCIGTR